MTEYFLNPRGNGVESPALRGEETFLDPRYPNVAFVGTGGKRSERSLDLVQGLTLVDWDGKRIGMNVPPGQAAGRCPHGQNPIACVLCFHTRNQPKPFVPQNQRPAPAIDPIIAAVKARQPAPDVAPGVPASREIVHLGQNPDGTPVEPKRTKTVVIGKMPVPVMVGGGGSGEALPARQNVMNPYDYATEKPGRIDSKGVWHPARHKSIIDTKDRHPNANDPVTQRLR